ncbi:MAG: efflux RND transporter periplasmic adaptor subunit [Lacunisphaera sp.]
MVFVRRASTCALAIALISVLAGCGQKEGSAPPPPGPIEVGVIKVVPTRVTLTRELPGRTSAYRVAEVRARVSGIVLKRLFTEGSDVKEGDILYQIDPAPYQAALDSAKGALARAQADATSARLLYDRYKDLIAAKAVSQQDYDNALSASKAADAGVAAAQAAVEGANISLGYTDVAAPIAGHIGRSQVTEGAYVQQGTATLLATIQQIDQLYVDVNQSTSEVFRMKKELESGQLKSIGKSEARVTLLLEDGSEYPEPGRLEFADVTVDPTTGSIGLRALFPNPHDELLPGMFVRARLEEGVNPAAILIPQVAITRNSQGQGVAMVVGADSKVEARALVTGRAIGDQWLVQSGLKAGDLVIVNNLQKIRPGAPVKPVPVPASEPVVSTPAAH